ncbi:MAG: EAL domain-containing protein [Candidatus Bathyarchaeota archaeon]
MKGEASSLHVLPQRLARRLVQFIVLTSSLIALFITGAQLYLEFERDVGDIHARFGQIEDTYLPSVVQNVWLTDRARVQVLVEGIRRLPDFASARVLVDGRPFAASGEPVADPALVRRFPLIQEFRGQRLEIGTLEVGASLSGPLQRTWQRLWFVLLLNSLKTALVAFVIFLLVRRLVTGPVQRMAAQARRLANGDLDQPLALDLRFPCRPDDEIHALSGDIERMRLKLRERRTALEASNDQLSRALTEKEIALLQARAGEKALQESRAHLARAQQVANLGSWEWTWGEEEMSWSDEIFHLLGLPLPSKEQPLPASLSRLRAAIHPEDRQRLEDQLADACSARQLGSAEFRIRQGDGSTRLVRQLVERLSADEEPPRLVGTLQDVTEQKRVEDALELAASVFANTREGILVTDPQGTILAVNPAFTKITGYDAPEAVGQTPRMLRSGRHDESFFEAIRQRLNETGTWQGEIWNRRKNGEAYPQWTSISTIVDATGQPKRRVAVISDVTELRKKDEWIRYQAYHDALTGLPNRLLLEDRLRQAIGVAHRTGSHVAILFIDLDRFKLVNDSLGHRAGDDLLKMAAGRIDGCLRASDTVARQGGDEFVLVVAGVSAIADVARVAEKIISTIGEGFDIADQHVYVGASIGISVYPQDGEDPDSLLQNADTAMYEAKAAGRGTFRFFDSHMNSRAVYRLQMEASLWRALAENQFEVFYQPKVDLGSGAIHGMEALVRWRDPEKGLISPAEFIPVAEEIGIIREIGDRVLDESCRQMRQWVERGLMDGPVAVNVSARQLNDPEFGERVKATLARHGLAPRWLQLEVTESTVMAKPEQAIGILGALVDLGITVAVDDFGTGYSSFGYLKRLPIHLLKIDRSFVDDIGASREDESIVTAIVTVARSLGLQTVAEGVETAAQAKFLAALGCDFGQGYLYSLPLPAAQFEALLAARSGRRVPPPGIAA